MFFKQLAMAAILFFSKCGQNYAQTSFIAVNIPCKFGEESCINEGYNFSDLQTTV